LVELGRLPIIPPLLAELIVSYWLICNPFLMTGPLYDFYTSLIIEVEPFVVLAAPGPPARVLFVLVLL